MPCSHSPEQYLNHHLEHKAETEPFLSLLREPGSRRRAVDIDAAREDNDCVTSTFFILPV